MATLKLKKKNPHAPAGHGPRSDRPPVRGVGAARKRPTLAEAQARREEHHQQREQAFAQRGNPSARGDAEPGHRDARGDRGGRPDHRDPRDPRGGPRGPHAHPGQGPRQDSRQTPHPDGRPPYRHDNRQDNRQNTRQDRPNVPRQGSRDDPRDDPRNNWRGPNPDVRHGGGYAGPSQRQGPGGHGPGRPNTAFGGRTNAPQRGFGDERPSWDERPRPPARANSRPQEVGVARGPRPDSRDPRDLRDPRAGRGPRDHRHPQDTGDQRHPGPAHGGRPNTAFGRQGGPGAGPQGGPAHGHGQSRGPVKPAGKGPFGPAGRHGPPPGARHHPRHDDDDDEDDGPFHHDAPDGIRLSKRMSALGLASRREADECITKGWVRVDGEVVSTLGARVTPEQRITVDAKARYVQAQKVTVLINKPVGYVSGQAEDGYEPASVLVVPANQWREDQSGIRFLRSHLRGLAPAGRLDIDSVGLLVLTQDGRVARQLIGEDSDMEKEYLVRVEMLDGGQLPDSGLALLNHGLELDGEALRPAQVEWVNEDQLRFVLREGKKRQIRRMCEAVGLKVLGLKRVRIGKVMLGDLPPGQWRYLRPDEDFGTPLAKGA